MRITEIRHGAVRLGLASRAEAGRGWARRVGVRSGMLRLGQARRGEAWQGNTWALSVQSGVGFQRGSTPLAGFPGRLRRAAVGLGKVRFGAPRRGKSLRGGARSGLAGPGITWVPLWGTNRQRHTGGFKSRRRLSRAWFGLPRLAWVRQCSAGRVAARFG